MAEEVGAPFNQIPADMFLGFSGGVGHWGTICGSLIPPVALISAVVKDKKQRSEMINEIMAWYTQFPFPEYQPKDLGLPQVVVGSTLCHVSVTKWCNEAGCSASSGNKKERCGGLSADVSKKTIQMLNEWKEKGKFVAMHKPDPVVGECMSCHKENQPYTQAKENCMNCHGSSLIDIEECDPHDKFM